jgi:hypothetical protein
VETRQLRGPIKLTPFVARRLIEAYRKGATITLAAKYAGITRQTLHTWLDDGRAQLEHLAEHTDGEDPTSFPLEAGLVLLLDAAQAEFGVELLDTIKSASPREWQAAAWLLERVFPDEYAKRQRVDHTHTIVAQVEQMAKDRGLDAEATARLIDFAVERARRGVA